MKTQTARMLVVVITLILVSVGGYLQPAWACGCGAMVSTDPLQVDGEDSIVRWDGSTEEIVMRLAVDSRAVDAAWVFPTPDVATVKLGDPRWFRQIDALTEPKVKVRKDYFPRWQIGDPNDGVGAPPGGGSVRVFGEQRLGPLTVATLDATDAGALSAWLSSHGYNLRPELDEALQTYVKRGWKYVAVKLSPEDKSALKGELDPLRISFASPELVYPMFLSSLASNSQQVHLWVLAPHQVKRVDADARRFPDSVQFSGRVSGVGGALGTFIGEGQWLTELNTAIAEPAEITSDWQMKYASSDKAYREEETEWEPVYILDIPAGWFVIGVAALTLLAAAIIVKSPRRRRTPGPTSAVPQ